MPKQSMSWVIVSAIIALGFSLLYVRSLFVLDVITVLSPVPGNPSVNKAQALFSGEGKLDLTLGDRVGAETDKPALVRREFYFYTGPDGPDDPRPAWRDLLPYFSTSWGDGAVHMNISKLTLAFLFYLPPARHAYKALRRRRRLNKSLCPACGYDLRATPNRCPECGWSPVAAKVRNPNRGGSATGEGVSVKS
jgi:hypothetical protein